MKKGLLFFVLVFTSLTIFSQSAGDVLITEFMARPSGTGSNEEWIELYNTTNSSIDIDDWTLSDAANHPINSSNGSTIIPANDFLILTIN